MLKELSVIANDLLGLHGYPRQPFGARDRAAPARPAEPAMESRPCSGKAPSAEQTPGVALTC